jgi:hypothetical protein
MTISLIYLYILNNLIYLAALNDALKQELERLKHATGEMTNSSETYNMRFQHVPYNSSFFPLSQQNASPYLGSTQLPPTPSQCAKPPDAAPPKHSPRHNAARVSWPAAGFGHWEGATGCEVREQLDLC